MILMLWIRGKILQTWPSLVGAAAGIALTVAFIVTLSNFLVAAKASMTARAISEVSIDWQLQATTDATRAEVEASISEAEPAAVVQKVYYIDVSSFQSRTGETTQRTGPGQIVLVDQGYFRDFPGELRSLSGDSEGILIAQQTAANLHLGAGGTVTIERVGFQPATVSVNGVVDLPDADTLFQAVGQMPGSGARAPPDNVLVFPLSAWERLFGPVKGARSQWHVRVKRAELPTDPVAAFTFEKAAARNLEVRLAGQGLLSDNLGARLDAVREDALYASVLFLFLGTPGVALAVALSFAISSAGAERRRREQALLRVRGVRRSTIVVLYLAEGMIVGVGGITAGLLAAAVLAVAVPDLQTHSHHIREVLIAVAAGMAVAVAAYVMPAWVDARTTTVQYSRLALANSGPALWRRIWMDVTLIGFAVALWWQSQSTGYQVVLAPEGVTATSVDYKAFIAPACAWLGVTLLIVRLCSGTLERKGPLIRFIARLASGRLAPIVAAGMSTQVRPLTVGSTATAIAIAFATTTASFNATYNAQARIDAQLVNGSDVTVFGTEQKPAGLHLPQLAALTDVAAAEPMQHRFAYVGSDLQDLYGIDPQRINRATTLSGTFFNSGSADETLRKLAAVPDGVLVSEETVQDFQLQEGDEIRLRLINAVDHQYHPVPFKFIGVVREFPTAPKDSFLVANAAYVSKSTHAPQQEYVLMRSDGDTSALAGRVRSLLGSDPSLKVSELHEAAEIIGSSLTAIDLRSLTLIELGFAVVTAAGAAGLIFGLGIIERRRSLVILDAIGAKGWQLESFLWSEGLFIFLIGGTLGLLWGLAAAWLLVKLLTGIFDPPPDSLTIPWSYLATVLTCVAGSIAAAVGLAMFTLGLGAERMRDL